MTADARLFVALHPPPAALDHLAGTVAGLHAVRAGARATPRDRWHVTLAFLGAVPPDRIDAAAEAVSTAAATVRPTTATIGGGGRFGRGRFTVLWTGVHGDGLPALSAAVRRQLRRARLPHDRKPFRPHLTLARPGDHVPPADIAADVAALHDYAGPPWTADRVLLIRSYLGPKPRYETLGGWPL